MNSTETPEQNQPGPLLGLGSSDGLGLGPERADFAQRCTLAANCLPVAEYRTRLERLHADMLAEIERLRDTLKRQDKAHHAEVHEQVAAERERCAKIVDVPPGTEAWEVIGGEEGLTMLRELAALIRSGA